MSTDPNKLDAEGRVWKRRWITFLGNVTLAILVVAYLVGTVGKKLYDTWKIGL